MKTIKPQTILWFLILLCLPPYTGQHATGQTPPNNRRYADGEAAFSEAARLYAIHTTKAMEEALEYCEKSRKAFAEAGSKHDEGLTLMLMGHINRDLSNRRISLKNFQQALPLFQAAKDEEMEAMTRSNIGAAFADLKEPQKALEAYNLALPTMRKVGNKAGEAEILFYLGSVYEELGEKQKALDQYQQALPIYKALSNSKQEAETLRRIGLLQLMLGENQEALENLNHALTMLRADGNKRQDEGIILANIGEAYLAVGQLEKALDAYRQALLMVRETGTRDSEAIVLYNLGMISFGLDQKTQAVDYFNQGLALYKLLGDQEGEQDTLSKVVRIHELSNEWQKALDGHDQNLALKRRNGDRKGEASILDQIGDIYSDLGERRKALEYMSQALQIQRAIGDKEGELVTLDSIANVYDKLGEKQKALEVFLQILSFNRANKVNGVVQGEPALLNNIGRMYDALGEQQKALAFLNESLTIHRGQGNEAGEAAVTNNIGMVYMDLGETRKAIEYVSQALKIYQSRGDKTGESVALTNMALAHSNLQEYKKGLEYANQALRLSKIIEDKEGEARNLSNIGAIYIRLGKKQKGLKYLTLALPLRRAVGDRIGEAATLHGIAEIYLPDEPEKAIEYLHQSLLLERAVRNRDGEATALITLASMYARFNNPQLAIFFGKQAVNRYQELRSTIRGIERQNQQTFLRSVESPFRLLSFWLLDEGRLAEAIQILNLFKDQEFFDATSPDNSTGAQVRKAELTQREIAADEMYEAATTRLASANLQLLEFEFNSKNQKRSAEEEQQLQQLKAQFEATHNDAQNTLRKIEASFAQSVVKEGLENTSDSIEMQAALRELSETTDSPTVALYTLTGPEKFSILVVTPHQLIPVSTKVSALDLIGGIIGNRNIRKDGLWELLNSPKHDPRPRANEIYNIVFKPIEPEIKRIEAAARKERPNTTVTLMWSLDWALRYIPIAALYDGKRYLAERYRNVVFTRANKEHLTRPVNANWTGLGFGSTEAQTVKIGDDEKFYDPLPGAEKELTTVFGTKDRQGILPGHIWLNEQFTKATFLGALKQRRPVVHIASHFTFEPGDEARSFLLLGQGETITLEEMKAHEGLFAGVELLALSACNTAAQQSGLEGREIDGFAELAQRLGAGAVLATLWPVSDDSTPGLIEEFYRLRQETPGRTKVEALRQAQVALLKGKLDVSSSAIVADKSLGKLNKNGRADIVGVKVPANSRRFKIDPKAPFAHPYYWSGFVLIGNWL